jgi:membrane protein implicated in regulation of membrane protease activity
MGIGVSLILIAVGAILTWGVTATASGLNIAAIGVILMIVGLIGLVLSMVLWSTWWGPGYFRRYAATGPVRRRRPARYPDGRGEVEEVIEEERY